MHRKNSHCSYCGTPFAVDSPWPRHCASCANTSFINPLPVAVLLVPVDDGLLTVRRSIPPAVGQLALPGGYINAGESWQDAAAREVYEETGLRVDARAIGDYAARSAPDGTLLVFGLAARLRERDLPPFVPNDEASEICILRQPAELAFPLHTEIVARYLAVGT